MSDLPVLDSVLQAKATKMGLVLTEKPGTVPPCGTEAHKPSWYLRPLPAGDMACDICHPSLETLQREGFPKKRNLAPAESLRKHVVREKWDVPTSDKAGEDAPGTVLFGSEELA